MEENNELYAKGYNAGYLLSKHDPELLKSILKSANKENEYFQAMIMGQKEHNREQLLEQLKQSQQSKERGLGR
jgi:hypothetical protein